MEKWVHDWHNRYSKLKKAVETTKNFNEKLFEDLTNECGALLETWMEMEDKLDDIKELKSSNNPTGQLKGMKNIENLVRLEGPNYFHLEIFDKAIELLKKDIANEPVYETILYLYLGFSYLYEGNIEKGKEAFLYVLHTSFNKIEKHFAYVGLGCLFGRVEQYEEAIHYYEKANSLYDNADVPYNIGLALIMLEKYKLAIPYLEETIANNEEDGEALYFLGLCYLKSGNETKAFERWFTALQVMEFKTLLVSIAYQFETHGFYTSAIHCYKRLEALGFQDAWVYHGMAWNSGLLDQKETAIEMFEHLIESYPSDINIWISYVWLLSKWQEKNRLQTVIDKLSMNNISHPLIEKIVEEC